MNKRKKSDSIETIITFGTAVPIATQLKRTISFVTKKARS